MTFEKNIKIDSRNFIIHIIKAKNGHLILISEGKELKIGSISISTKMGETITTSTIIPNTFNELFGGVLAQFLLKIINGILITSLYFLTKLDTNITKVLLKEIKTMLQEGNFK